ncbi:protein lifeguard 1 [Drosophila serrata]|uniref:protein lifeguard 1 n=1 Tax=Drosophila serrata TaxID=7274 RepID=UPI000A1D3675|nr:protein lifeguard 1 [Drosophila serrata]
MQLHAVILVLVLAEVAHCRPTLDKIAEVLLNAFDDPQPHYHQPGRPLPGERYPYPHPGPGPLIQEGYEHGYDYHYGGGYGYQGYQQEPHPGYPGGYYPQRQPAHHPTSYYPPPQSSRPGYYAHRPALPTPASGGYYQDQYGGGYKQRGY